MPEKFEVTRTVDAPVEQVFALLADPRRHAEIDASSMVQGSESGPVTGVGQTFTVDMFREDLGHYRTRNTITEFVADSRIGWAPALDQSFSCGLVDQLAGITTGGHTYTYQLDRDGSGTRVTQVYDWSAVQDPQFAAFCPLITQEQLAGTLEALATAVEAAPSSQS